jgi:hypothetical protein
VSNDHRFEIALKAALSVIHTFDRPMDRQEKLAKVTYAILEAILRAEARSSSRTPALPSLETVRRSVAAQPTRPLGLPGEGHEAFKLPSP